MANLLTTCTQSLSALAQAAQLELNAEVTKVEAPMTAEDAATKSEWVPGRNTAVIDGINLAANDINTLLNTLIMQTAPSTSTKTGS